MFILPYLRPYYGTLVLVLILATCNQVFSLLDPQVFGWLMDNYITQIDILRQTPDILIHGVLLGMGGLVGVAMISRLAKNFQDYFANVMGQKIGMAIFADTIAHAFHLPYAQLEDQSSGQLLQNIQKAKTDIQAYILSLINTVFTAIISIGFVLIVGFMTHWVIGAVLLSLFPVMGLTSYYLSKNIKKAQDTIVSKSAALAGATTETIRNISLVKILGLEPQELARINTANDGILTLELQKIRTVRSMEFIQGTIVNGIRVGLIGFLVWMIYTGHLSVGQFFTFFFYSFFIFAPLGQLGNVMKAYQEAKASHDTLQTILSLDISPTVTNPTPITPLTTISLDHIGFGYTADRPIITDLSLTMKQGHSYAFVGPSGSGKSTILKLLVGLYIPTTGHISYNDHDLTTYDLHDLNKRIGIVTQDPQLFSGTIFQNLTFVQPDATIEQCMEVLEQAQLSEFITSLADGIYTSIGEGGLKLSGGQKQRLAIARALLRNPELLIFDEATSSLDSLIEKEISDTIERIATSRSHMITILVAHRLSTIKHADTICVLERGTIIQQGDHTSLVSDHDGLYYALWREQIGANVGT